MDQRRALHIVTALLLAVLLVAGPVGAAPPDSVVTTSDCVEHQAFVDGDAAAVERRLPDGYSAEVNPTSGRPLLFVRALRCRVNDAASPTTFASFGVVISSPDGTHCSAASPVDVPALCNWYVLSWLADDAELVRWLRHGSPDFPVTFVSDLVLEERPFDLGQGGAGFRFEAGTGAPSPFTMEATTRERPGELRPRGAYWADVRQGTVRIGFATDDLVSGDATGVVRAASGSDLAEVMGQEESAYALGYSVISAERWQRGTYRKQIIGDSGAGTTFDGTCSVAGTVTFEPGATVAPQELRYRYAGKGVCSGDLDGRTVEDLPVAVRQRGRSEGSCVRAQTAEPGDGTLRFAGGETLHYNLEFTSIGTEVDFTFYGARSGSASGQGTFRTDRTAPGGASRCGSGGVTEVPMDMTMTTGTPLTSSPRPHRSSRRGR